jgi:(2Fe-2S) ferredoxin
VAVVYPDNIWYQYIDEEDIDEIINKHLIAGKPVNRLKID